MRMNVVWLMCATFTGLYAQSWVGNGYSLSISLDETDGRFEIVANSDGIHLVYDTGSALDYRRFNAAGTQQGGTVTIASYTETPKAFNIVEVGGDLYVFYKKDDELLTKRSTNTGSSFSSVASAISLTETESDGLDAWPDHNDDEIQVVWSEGSTTPDEIWYHLLDINGSPSWSQGELKNVTDVGGTASAGARPSIAFGSNRAHVGFSIHSDVFNGAPATRDKTTSWQSANDPNAGGLRAKIALADGNLHMVFHEYVSPGEPFEDYWETHYTKRSATGSSWDTPTDFSSNVSEQIYLPNDLIVAANDVVHFVFGASAYTYFDNSGWQSVGYVPGGGSGIHKGLAANGNDVYVVLGVYDSQNAEQDLKLFHRDYAPIAPQGIAISIVNAEENPRLDWDANPEVDLDEYVVEKRVGGGSWSNLASTTNTYYIDTSVEGASLTASQGDDKISYRTKAKDDQENVSEPSLAKSVFVDGGDPPSLTIEGDYQPQAYVLHDNYPNPFNPSTSIKYDIPDAVHLSLRIYNLYGQLVRTLANSEHEAGSYTVEWNGRDESGERVSSGVYVYSLDTAQNSQSKKMILIK